MRSLLQLLLLTGLATYSASCTKEVTTTNSRVAGETTESANALSASAPDSVSKGSGLNVTWEKIEGASAFELSISTREDCSNPILSVTGLKDQQYSVTLSQVGVFYVCLKAVSATGVVLAQASLKVQIKDDESNTVSIDALALSSANSSNKNEYSFLANCTGADTFVVQAKDGNGDTQEKSSTCANDKLAATVNLGSLADGDITLTVYDELKTKEITKATINKDTSAPTVSITSPTGGAFVNNTNLSSFAVSGTCSENGQSVTVAVGSAEASANCASGSFSASLDLTAASSGALSVSVSHVDSVGNGGTGSSVSVTKDITTVLAVTNANGSYVNSTSASSYTISGTCSEDTRAVSITGDATASPNCSSGNYTTNVDLSAKADGSLSFTIRHEAASGNFDEKTLTLAKDASAPSVSVSGAPASIMNGSSLSVTVAGTGVVNYKYDLLGSAAANCSGASYSASTSVGTAISETLSSDDDYRLCVVGLDAAGNVSSASETAFTRDTQDPDVFDISGLANYTNSTTPTISWTASTGAATYDLLVDDTNDCSSPVQTYNDISATSKTLSSLGSDGTYYLCLSSKDSAGNTKNATTNPASFALETQLPNTPTTPSDAGTYDDTTVTFSWSDPGDNGASGIASFYVQVGTSAGASDVYAGNEGTNTSYQFAGSNGSSYYIRVKAIDNAGNESSYSSSSDGVYVDSAAPTAASSLKEAPDATTDADADGDNDTSIYLVWSAGSDAHSGLAVSNTYKVSWYSQTACGGSATEVDTTALNTQLTNLSNGTTYSFSVRTFDKAGNFSDSGCSDGIIIDNMAPPALTSFGGSTGSGAGLVSLSLDFPADVSDYNNIKIYRSSSSGSTGVSAPSCGSGTLVTTVTDFSTDPTTISDNTGETAAYFSYRACVYDVAGNDTYSNTTTDILSADNNYLRSFDAAKLAGSSNAGDIGANTDTAWVDLSSNTTNGTLSGFSYSAGSGWDGDGSVADPYRLTFDGSGDTVALGSIANVQTVSVWFNPSNPSSTASQMVFDQYPNRFWVTNGNLNMHYNDTSNVYTTGVEANRWYHMLVTNDGSTTNFYLDAVLVASQSKAAYSSSQNARIGSDYGGAGNPFSGSIASVQLYDEGFSFTQVMSAYNEGKYRFTAEPSVATIESVFPNKLSTSGGDTITIYGAKFSGATSVTIGGVAASSYTVNSDYQITATVPAGSVGSAAVVVIAGGNTATATNAVSYTATKTTDIMAWLDAENIDRAGTKATSASSTSDWRSVKGVGAGLINFSFDSDSGWNGDGSTADPHRIEFDGSGDSISIGTLKGVQTIATWFRTDNAASSSRQMIIDHYGVRTEVLSGSLLMQYNDSTIYSTGIGSNKWHHMVVTNDGSASTFYLDGVVVATQAKAAYNTSQKIRIGSDYSGTANSLDGAIASVRVYSAGLSSSDVMKIYDEEKYRFSAVPSVVTIEKLFPNKISSAGGDSIEIYGAKFTNTTSVTIGGIAASSFTINSDNHITATAAAGSVGYANVSVTADSNTATASNSVYYTATKTSNVMVWLDAENIDRWGTPGSSISSTDEWLSVMGKGGGFVNFNYNGTSGWSGDGSTGDPYHVKFDGNDSVNLGYLNKAKTFSAWFNVNNAASGAAQMIIDNYPNRFYVQSGNVKLAYNSGTYHDAAVSSSTWYHILITNDGTTSYFYLDGSQFSTETKGAYTANQKARVGSDYGSAANPFTGSIAGVRIYDTNLTPTEVTAIYDEEKGRFGY